MTDGPLTRDGIRVQTEMCGTCIFRAGNLMHLHSGRLREMIDGALRNDSFIVCHDTLDGPLSVCRGFWDRHRRDTLGCRLAAFIGEIST